MQTIGVSDAADGRHGLAIHRHVGLAEQRPPLGVADDDVLGARLLDHRGADLAGEGAFPLPVHVLRRHADVGVARRLARGVHRGKRRRDDDRDVVDVLDEAAQLFDVDRRFVNGLEHLPVAGDERYSHSLISSV